MKFRIEFTCFQDMEIVGHEGNMEDHEDMAEVARVLQRCLYPDQLYDLQEALEKALEQPDAKEIL